METSPAIDNLTARQKADLPAKNDRLRETEAHSGEELEHLVAGIQLPWLKNLLAKLNLPRDKKSFLVFKDNKYLNVLTENIAFFYLSYDNLLMMSFDRQEYPADYSLEQVENLIASKQFFRLNRQYLINFNAIKEVEHYFARKLLVTTYVPVKDKLLVSREKVSEFLHWLDDR